MLEIGETYERYGLLAAIGLLDHERYYWFISDDGRSFAMMPAVAVEDQLKKLKPKKKKNT